METESNTITFALQGIECRSCYRRAHDLLLQGRSLMQAQQVYKVGNVKGTAHQPQGHLMYFMPDGQGPLCHAAVRTTA